MTFLELDETVLAGATLIIDVDGTLVSDRHRVLGADTEAKLKRLATVCDVHLCSNGSPGSAVAFAAQAGVSSFPALKPFPRSARHLMKEGKRVVVIGDKYLTDGIFAALLGAEFIRVAHMRSADDGSFARFSYALDALAWRTSPFVLAMRPWQWVKNLLVFAPLFFAAHVADAAAFVHTVLAFAAFSFAASAMYVFNDLQDTARDRLHPRKRFRPIASGRLGIVEARLLLIACIALAAGASAPIPAIIVPVIAYIILNIAYSSKLKHIAVVDIACVAAFYLLRIVAGGFAAGVPLSPWIMLCALFGSLFVIIGKRRAEAYRAERRAVLEQYSPQALDFMLVASAALAIMAYGVYSVIGHPSSLLVYSTGFVAFALFRMLNRIYTNPDEAEAPETLVFRDPWILGSFLGWVAYVGLIFYML